MAEVSYFNLHGDGDDEDDVVTLDSLPYWAQDFNTYDVFPSDPEFSPSDLSHTIAVRRRDRGHSLGFEDDPVSDSVTTLNLFHRENQVNYVMDLFHQRVEESVMAGEADLVPSDPEFDLNFGVVAANDEMGSSNLDLDLGLGLGFSVDRHDDDDNGFMVADCGDDFFVSRRETASQSGGSSTAGRLREVEIESGSEEGGNEHGFALDGEEDGGLETLCWDSFQLDDRRDAGEDFEWEEVDEGVDEREVLSMFLDTEVDEDLDGSVASVVVPSQAELDIGGTMRNLEWEVLLLDLHANSNIVDPNLDDQDDYNYATEYEMLFGQFAENENAIMGRPPASKTVVENLASIALTQEDVDQDNALCAVCKDEMKVGEQSKELPCSHRYHGECILPWLGIRNTCPVCRYELPTDDPEYERRRSRSAGRVQ